MTITATFKGRDGSMGYKYGRAYHLEVERFGDWLWIFPKGGPGRPLPCPYASREALERNWTMREGVKP